MNAAPHFALMAAQDLPAIAENAEVPEWIHLVPTGAVDTFDGRGPYELADPQSIIARSFSRRGEIEIDINHATFQASPLGLEAPAQGWIVEMEAREDGIWGRVKWTNEGRRLVAERAYRRISPVFELAGTATLSLLSDSLTVDGSLVTMATVTAELDSLDSQLALKVAQTEFDGAETRLSGVEVTLGALDVPAFSVTITDTRRIDGALTGVLDSAIADLWQGFAGRGADRQARAVADLDLRAAVADDLAAESGLRLQLAVEHSQTAAALEAERRTRADETGALAEDVVQLQADLTAAEGGVSGNAAALASLSATVTSQGGTLAVQAADITQLQADLGAAEGDIAANGTALASLTTTVTSQGRTLSVHRHIGLRDRHRVGHRVFGQCAGRRGVPSRGRAARL